MDREFLGFMGTVLGLFAGLALVVIFFVNLAVGHSCMVSYADYHPQYGFWEGCRIEWQGKMTPTDMIKNINLAN